MLDTFKQLILYCLDYVPIANSLSISSLVIVEGENFQPGKHSELNENNNVACVYDQYNKLFSYYGHNTSKGFYNSIHINILLTCSMSQHVSYTARRGPRVVVSTAAFHARVWGSFPGLGGLKETKMFLPHPSIKLSIARSLRDREVACSASDRQGSEF